MGEELDFSGVFEQLMARRQKQLDIDAQAAADRRVQAMVDDIYQAMENADAVAGNYVLVTE